MRVGVLYVEGAEQAASALGVNGLATGDAAAQARAVFAWVNANGGIAGQQAQPSYAGIQASESVNNPQLAQERACRKLTEDDKVRYVVSYVNLLPATMDCFAKAGVGMVNDQSNLPDSEQARHRRVFTAPGDFAPGRTAVELVDALWRTGWLTKDSVIGAYTFDTPENHRVIKDFLVPALARHGLRIEETAAVANSADGIAQNSNVVVQYRAAGVDRVLPIASNPLFLMQAASSQGYRPRYAFYSLYGPGALVESAAPRDQLSGAAGIGWAPWLDIGAGTRGGPVSPWETLCFDLMAKSGQGSDVAVTKGLQLQLCNAIFYLKGAGDRVGSTAPGLLEAARPAVGRTFVPADTFLSDVSRRPDGAAGYRDLVFSEDCSCFQYASPVRRTAA